MSLPMESMRRVLVIEDSAAYRRLVRRHLQDESILVIEAEDGDEGFLQATLQRPDLILLDIQLPGRDGFDLLRRLKDDTHTQSIPVIFLSGSCAIATKARGLDLGAVDFISKPFEPIELRARVRAAMRTKYLQDLLEQRAHLDGLTGLGNRLALEERLRAEWSLSRRRGSSLGVLIADLDRFKAINDRHGHPAGDAILRGAASALREAVRTGDFVARFGGEEFVVVAPDCDLEGVVAIGERFRAGLASMRGPYNPLAIPISASAGAAASEPEDDRPDVLLRRADAALYQAKSSGRDAVWACARGLMRPANEILTARDLCDGGFHPGVERSAVGS